MKPSSSGLGRKLRRLGIQRIYTPSSRVVEDSGTCAMMELDQGGVVDKDLNVYGTKNLKVAGSPPNGDGLT
jgi:hypothetical protein